MSSRADCGAVHAEPPVVPYLQREPLVGVTEVGQVFEPDFLQVVGRLRDQQGRGRGQVRVEQFVEFVPRLRVAGDRRRQPDHRERGQHRRQQPRAQREGAVRACAHAGSSARSM
jgi:hypothetical protein